MSLPDDPIAEIKTVIIMVVCIVLIGLIGYLAYTKSLLETKVAEQQVDISSLQEQNVNFKTQAEASNAAFQKIQSDAMAREAAAAESIATANRQATAFEAEAKRLAAVNPVGDDCAATKSFLKSYFGGRP